MPSFSSTSKKNHQKLYKNHERRIIQVYVIDIHDKIIYLLRCYVLQYKKKNPKSSTDEYRIVVDAEK